MSYSIILCDNKVARLYESYEHIFCRLMYDVTYYSYGHLRQYSGQVLYRSPEMIIHNGIEYYIHGDALMQHLIYINRCDVLHVNPKTLAIQRKFYVSKIYEAYNGQIFYRKERIKDIDGLQELFIHKCGLDIYHGFVSINNNVYQFKAFKTNIHVYPEIYLRGFRINGQSFVRTIDARILRNVYCDILVVCCM